LKFSVSGLIEREMMQEKREITLAVKRS